MELWYNIYSISCHVEHSLRFHIPDFAEIDPLLAFAKNGNGQNENTGAGNANIKSCRKDVHYEKNDGNDNSGHDAVSIISTGHAGKCGQQL